VRAGKVVRAGAGGFACAVGRNCAGLCAGGSPCAGACAVGLVGALTGAWVGGLAGAGLDDAPLCDDDDEEPLEDEPLAISDRINYSFLEAGKKESVGLIWEKQMLWKERKKTRGKIEEGKGRGNGNEMKEY
jgi:hypothetical protein